MIPLILLDIAGWLAWAASTCALYEEHDDSTTARWVLTSFFLGWTWPIFILGYMGLALMCIPVEALKVGKQSVSFVGKVIKNADLLPKPQKEKGQLSLPKE